MRTILMAAILAFAQSASFATKPRASSGSHEPAQSLTYHNIIAHLKSAGLRATEVQKRCTVFFEGEWKDANRYDYCLIIVENSDEDVQVTFYLTDAHEMNWITEFLDASYFTSAETQKLFGIVNAHASTHRLPKLVAIASSPITGSQNMRRFSSSALRRPKDSIASSQIGRCVALAGQPCRGNRIEFVARRRVM